jgi:hypothetical protein
MEEQGGFGLHRPARQLTLEGQDFRWLRDHAHRRPELAAIGVDRRRHHDEIVRLQRRLVVAQQELAEQALIDTGHQAQLARHGRKSALIDVGQSSIHTVY